MSDLPGGYVLTDDPALIDAMAAHAYLTRSYWSPGIALETVQRALANSMCVAVRCDAGQVAFGRLITDKATFAYLADVHVLEDHRGLGLASAMIRYFQSHAELQGLRRWLLGTLDAHELYIRHGWQQLASPERAMERWPAGSPQ